MQSLAAHYAKNETARLEFAEAFIRAHLKTNAIWIHPKNIQRHPGTPHTRTTTYEELTKTDTWLALNNSLNSQTVLILENPSRYPKITSEKVTYLQRLSMGLTRKAIIDIVPFTLDITYLYTPYSYLDRSIIGFAHWYAFREGYKEMTPDGTIKSSHDHASLAAKIAPVATLDYQRFTPMQSEVINFQNSKEEHKQYQQKRAELFKTETSPQKIITALSDLTHAMPTRMAKVRELCAQLDGPVLILTNLGSYAKKHQSAFNRAKLTHCIADSYQLAPTRDDLNTFSHIVIAEAPIVRSYFLLDTLARLQEHTKIWRIQGNTKVDIYLNHMMDKEINAIDSFVLELHRTKNAF